MEVFFEDGYGASNAVFLSDGRAKRLSGHTDRRLFCTKVDGVRVKGVKERWTAIDHRGCFGMWVVERWCGRCGWGCDGVCASFKMRWIGWD